MTADDIARMADAIDGIGTADFPRLFCAFFDSARPVKIFSTHADPQTPEALAVYLDAAFVWTHFTCCTITKPATAWMD